MKSEAEASVPRAAFAPTDLSTGQGVSRTASTLFCRGYGGQLDILVNNVGSGAIRTFDQLTDEDWETDATAQLHELRARVPEGAAGAATAHR